MFTSSLKIVLGTTVAVSLAACGAAGGPGGGNEKISDGKLVLGVLNDQSGPYKDLSGPNSVEAVKMAVDDWKAAHKDDAVTTDIEVITADFSTKPDVANTKAQEMYDRENADIILDVPNSAAALAVATQAKNKKRVYINVGGGTSALTGASCNKYTLHWAYDTYMLANGAAKSVTESGGKNWSIVYPDYEFGQASDKLYTGAVEAAGGKVISHIPTPFPNENFATFITKARQGNPDVIASMHGGGDLANFFKQYQQSGGDKNTKVVGGVVFLSDIKSIGAETLKGMQFTDSWYWNMDKEARAWADRFQEKVGTRPTAINAGNYPPPTSTRGRPGGRHRQVRRRRGEAGGQEDQRHLPAQRRDPGQGPPRHPRRVPGRGQGPQGHQGGRGLREDRHDDPRRQRLPPAGPVRVLDVVTATAVTAGQTSLHTGR